jgi:hypothetical protein
MTLDKLEAGIVKAYNDAQLLNKANVNVVFRGEEVTQTGVAMRSRWVINLFTALSLGVVVALVALWVRGRWTADIFHWTGASLHGQVVTLYERHLTFSRGSAWWWDRTVRSSYGSAEDAGLVLRLADDPSIGHGKRPAFVIRLPREKWSWLGFEGSRRSAAAGTTGVSRLPGAVVATTVIDETVTLLIPLWAAAAAASVPPAVWLARRGRRRRRQRQHLGLCVECGYDIRATPGRCPECGAIEDLASRHLGRSTMS